MKDKKISLVRMRRGRTRKDQSMDYAIELPLDGHIEFRIGGSKFRAELKEIENGHKGLYINSTGVLNIEPIAANAILIFGEEK
jgi:hypothetical protein